MAAKRLQQHLRVLLPFLLAGGRALAQDPVPECDAAGNESCAAAPGQDAPDSLGLLQQRIRSSQDTRAALRPASAGGGTGGKTEIGLDMLVMADIGHAREYASYLTTPFPMEYGRVEGSFSLYDGIANYILQQGVRPQAALIAGDVGYGGGTQKVLESMKASFQQYSNRTLPENMIFPSIGNHDVSYLGCTKTPQMVFAPIHKETCFYGGKTVNIWASAEEMTYSQWTNNWALSFPGLSGGAMISPPLTTGTCKTTGGNANGAPCKFTFSYLLTTYNSCITKDTDPARPWCYTTDYGKWGYCSTTCTPNISSWKAPTRYNLDLSPSSSVYFIVGLIPGAELTYWNGDTPPESLPAGAEGSSQMECRFLGDSLAHGKSLGKTIFIYATHWFQESCEDWSLVQQIDIWLYGHDHNMWQAPPRFGTVVQEQRYFPAAMLLGNGGYDDGQTPNVSFVHLTEEIANGRSKVTIKVLDTCESETECPSTDVAFLAQCWHKCKDYPDGYNNRKAVPSPRFGFTYDAPRSAQGTLRRSLDFPAKLQLDSKWVALGDCGSVAVPPPADALGAYRSEAGSGLVDPHSSALKSKANISSDTGKGSGGSGTLLTQVTTKPKCVVAAEDEGSAATFHFYDVGEHSMRLTVDSDDHAPLVQEGNVLLQRYGFYDLYLHQPTPPYTTGSGIGRMRPKDGYLMSFSSPVAEGANTALGVGFVDGVLQVLSESEAGIPAAIVQVA